jgi:CAAX prenyl protease-like protein
MADHSGAEKLAEPVGNWVPYRHYPWAYAAKIALTLAAVIFVWPVFRQFPFRVSGLAVLVGAVGVVLWVVFCHLQLEAYALRALGIGGLQELWERAAYNPFEQLAGHPIGRAAFLLVRFFGLAVLVPIVEEFFYRGFMMRLVVAEEWWKVPIGQVNRAALVIGTAIPALAHPSELLAAVVWFSLVTWLMVRTRNIWDCVAAHGVTNLLLGLYVIAFDQWQLW